MPRPALITSLLFLCALAGLLSLSIGPSGIQFQDAMRALFQGQGDVYVTVMREIRLPRLILSLIIGFALGLSGAAMQGYLRNPLAEPGVLGISSASALGAVIALQTGLAFEGIRLTQSLSQGHLLALFGLPIAAMAGAFIVAILLFLLGKSSGLTRLILIGIGISALAGALTALVLNLSPNPFAAAEIMFWMMGSVADRSMIHVLMALPFVLIGAIMILSLGHKLDALSLGEDTAQSLGVSIPSLNRRIILAVTMMVGATVAVAGAIGFIGLIVPHMLRPFAGARPSRLLLPAGLGGAFLLTTADILTRIIAPERDLKLGVLTALIGAPIFLHLITRKTHGDAS